MTAVKKSLKVLNFTNIFLSLQRNIINATIMKTNLLFALLILGSLFGFAQKAPKGKLVSYSHSYGNPEIPLKRNFDLSWTDGKGTLVTHEMFISNVSGATQEVSEAVFLQVADIIKENKLYTIGKKKAKKSKIEPLADPTYESYAISFEDMTVHCDGKDVSLEQRTALDSLEAMIRQAAEQSVPAPKGRLVACSWSWQSLNPGSGGEYRHLTVSEGKAPVLVVGTSNSLPDDEKTEQQFDVSPEDVKRLQDLIIQEKAYLFDGYSGKDHSGRNPECHLMLRYDDGTEYSARWTSAVPPDEVTKARDVIRDFLESLVKRVTPTE